MYFKPIVAVVTYFLCSMTVEAQDTNCIKRTVDQFDGSTSYSFPTESLPINQETTMMVLAGGSGTYAKKSFTLFFKNKMVRSVDDKSEVIFLFTDGTKQKVMNGGRYDPSGLFMLMYYEMEIGGGKKMIKELLEKKIKAIRFSGYSNNNDIELDSETSVALQEKLNCFYNGWKIYSKK